jgi:hypothetical protein
MPDIDFVLEEQFQELCIRQPVSFRFVQPHFQTAKQSGKT